jgi:hypothetical protein
MTAEGGTAEEVAGKAAATGISLLHFNSMTVFIIFLS